MRRVHQEQGQLLLDFSLAALPEPEPASDIVVAPVMLPATPRAKQRQKKPHFHPPGVVFVKKGRQIRIKPLDGDSADVWREVCERMNVPEMREVNYFGAGSGTVSDPGEKVSIPVWSALDVELEHHPFAAILQSYGVPVYIDPCLRSFMRRERRRQALERAPYPLPPVQCDVSMFERCSEGTMLRCIKDFTRGGTTHFIKDQRYMVISAGGEGRDTIVISTVPVADKAVLSNDEDKKYAWSSFEVPMEDHFDDSEEMAPSASLPELFPEEVQGMRRRLDKLNLPLWEHVKVDVALAAFSRGGINAYPMRMGKTGFSIALARVREKKKVAFIGPRNARIFTVNELKRLGFRNFKELSEEEQKDPAKQADSFVIVEKLADLEKPCWMYLITYSWIKGGGPKASTRGFDPTAKPRANWENYLKPSRHVRFTRKYGTETTSLCNLCPHCQKPLERRIALPHTFLEDRWVPLHELDTITVAALPKAGIHNMVTWTEDRGYICRNPDCSWTSDNRRKDGAAWNEKRATRVIRHRKGSYVDLTLALHARCPDVKLPGRQCPHCRATDGVWTPPLYKRCSDKFTMIIADEIHACKDPSADVSRAIYSLHGDSPWGLTGTLISNDATDAYWPLHYTQRAPNLQFPYVGRPGAKEYEKRFCDHITLEKPIGEEKDEVTGQTKTVTKLVSRRIPFLKNPPDFWRFMENKVIRRTYDDVLFQQSMLASNRFMPKPEIDRYHCTMDPEQAKLMLVAIRDFRGQFSKMVDEAKKKGTELNSALVISQMSTLRTLATCPEKYNFGTSQSVYKGEAGGGKRDAVKRLVHEHTKNNGKVVILSDFITMQKTMTEALKEYKPIRFNTSWDDDARREAFEAFQMGDENRVFIAGTRAVREGVDLSRADTCICCDMLWAPGLQAQAWSRILAPQDRERNCKIYLMVSSNSLDEHIYTVFYSKLIAASQAMDRKVMNRRVQEFDVKFFVERVLEEENAIQSYLRESEGDTILMPDLDLHELEAREI